VWWPPAVMSSIATSAAKGAMMSKIKSTVAEQAKDENTKLGGFLKRGTAVAEKAVSKALNSEVACPGQHCPQCTHAQPASHTQSWAAPLRVSCTTQCRTRSLCVLHDHCAKQSSIFFRTIAYYSALHCTHAHATATHTCGRVLWFIAHASSSA
jgi:hypothetical protein